MLGALAIVATLAEEELQCVVKVMSCVVPSMKEPVAVNCCVLPTVTLGLAGEIASETNVPVPTVNVAVPSRPEAVAEIDTVPIFFLCERSTRTIDSIFGFKDFALNLLR